MKKVFKWIGIVLGSLIGLILVAALGLYVKGNAQLSKTYDFPSSGIVAPTDPASLARGEHIVQTVCVGCHGADLGGEIGWFAGGPLGTIDAANLTSGAGGVGQEYQSDEDYVRAIRHGIDREGQPIYMPAVLAAQYLSDEDLAAVIAYLKSLPPVDRETNGHQFSPLAKILSGAGALGKLPVEEASHKDGVTAPAVGVTIEYGEYLVNISDCKSCHGQELAGGSYPDPSVTQLVPNLTPGGELGAWTEEQFIQAIRTGITPSGHELNPDLMPWKEISLLSSEELQAMWLFLQSLPNLPQVTP